MQKVGRSVNLYLGKLNKGGTLIYEVIGNTLIPTIHYDQHGQLFAWSAATVVMKKNVENTTFSFISEQIRPKVATDRFSTLPTVAHTLHLDWANVSGSSRRTMESAAFSTVVTVSLEHEISY
jgi:hypothetical protein